MYRFRPSLTQSLTKTATQADRDLENTGVPKISVVMSVYNGEKYLRDAIESILDQSFKDFEFIIVNDASTDGTLRILREYADTDKRIVLVNNEKNLGLTKSLNKAMRLARGEYIARQDADDISHLERLREQLNFLENHPETGLVGTRISCIDARGNEFKIRKNRLSDSEIREELRVGNAFTHGSVMFKKECLNAAGYYREEFKYTQDYDLWLRISEHYRVANIDKVLYKLRRNKNTITRNRLNEQLNYHLLAIQLAKERQQSKYDSLNIVDIRNLGNELINRYRLDADFIRRFKLDCLYAYYIEARKIGDYCGTINLWIKIFLLRPKKESIRLLLARTKNALKSIAINNLI